MSPQKNKKMVYVYLTDISNLPDPTKQPEIVANLSANRQQKIAQMKLADKRRQSLGAGLLLEKVLGRYGLSENDIRLGENGKPEIEGLYFNLSHSGTLVACAVGSKPVGCDIERFRKTSEKIAERFFCDGERTYLKQFSGDAYKEEFLRLWTMKESYMKMTGEGMRLPLDSFELIMENEVKIIREGRPLDCHIKEYDVSEYKLTVCAMEDEFQELIWETVF